LEALIISLIMSELLLVNTFCHSKFLSFETGLLVFDSTFAKNKTQTFEPMKKGIFAITMLSFNLAYSQVGIGTQNPDKSSILHLDVSSMPVNGKKGFLGPKVALASRTDQTTIPIPAVGLLVWNLGTAGLATEGFHFWNGTEWRMLASSSAISPNISSIDCTNAYFNPPQFTANAPYTGVMVVPYKGGNGGSYPSGTPIASTGNTGLTATLRTGTLTNGDGELVYDLVGTPAQSSPNTAYFPISFLGQNCTAGLSGDLLRIGETIGYFNKIQQTVMTNYGTAPTTSYASYFLTDLPVIEGIRLDLRRVTNGATYSAIFTNTTSAPISLRWQVDTGGSNAAAGNLMTLTPGQVKNVSGDGSTPIGDNATIGWNTTFPAVAKFNIVINNTRWYRVEYYCASDNSTTPTASDYHNIRMSIERLQ